MEIAETLSGTHATQTAHQAAAEKYDAVFAIGGDGTVGQVASGLLDSETALSRASLWHIECLGAGAGTKTFQLVSLVGFARERGTACKRRTAARGCGHVQRSAIFIVGRHWVGRPSHSEN